MITIKADRSALIPEYDMHIGFENDNLVEERLFEIKNRKIFGYAFRLDIGNTDNTVMLEKYSESPDSLVLRWSISAPMIGSGGTIRTQIRAFNPDGEEVWHSAIMEFEARSSINATSALSDERTVSEFEQVEAEVQRALDSIEETVSEFSGEGAAAAAAYASAQALCAAASENAESARESADAAKDSEDAAGAYSASAREYSDMTAEIYGSVLAKEAAAASSAANAAASAAAAGNYASNAATAASDAALQAGIASGYAVDAQEAAENFQDEIDEIHSSIRSHTHLCAVPPGGYVDMRDYGLEETVTENVYKAEYDAENVDEQGKTVYSFCRSGDIIEISDVNGIEYEFYINGEYVALYEDTPWTGTLTAPVKVKLSRFTPGSVELSVRLLGGSDGLMSKEDKAKLDGIDDEISTLQGEVDDLGDDVSTLNGSVSNLQSNVSTMSTALTNLSGDVSNLSGSVSALQGNVSTLNGSVNTLGGAVTTLSSDVGTLSGEVDDLGDEVDGIGNQVSDIDTALDDILTIQHTLIGGRPVTWADIRSAVRDGKAEQYFSIGDQLTVELVPNITCSIGDSTGISGAAVDKNTFVVKTGMAHDGTYSFIYGGKSWRSDSGKVVDLIDYGITVTGSPAEGDTVTITEATAGSLVFDVIGFDHDTPTNSQLTHSMTLQLHKELDTALRFDSPEAAFYIDANTYPQGLAAGTYNFTWTYDTGSIVRGTYQFTLAEDVPVGGQIVIGTNRDNVALTDCKISTYAAVGDTNAIESDAAITSGSGGTSLGTITATDVTDSVNSAQHIMYGSNRWATSGIRQWLNADGAANTWWQAKTVFDRPTNADVDGFLKDIDAAFLDIIGEVSKTTQKSGYDGYGLETTAEKFFLLSRPEVYGGTERSADGADGTVYAYYGEGHSDLPSPGTGADSNRIKYRDSSAQSWILRTPSASSIGIRYIASSGGVASGYAMTRTGIAPACVIV